MNWENYKKLSFEEREEWQFKFGKPTPIISGNDLITFFYLKWSVLSFIFMLALTLYLANTEVLNFSDENIKLITKVLLLYSQSMKYTIWAFFGVLIFGVSYNLYFHIKRKIWERRILQQRTIR